MPGQRRLSKDSLVIEVVGTLDELNCALGLARVFGLPSPLAKIVEPIQHRLFDIGAYIADSQRYDTAPKTKPVSQTEVLAFEQIIDRLWSGLPELKTFIIPGGSQASAHLHQARAISRRLERRLISLDKKTKLKNRALMRWSNRLSDLLFVLARTANIKGKSIKEVKWRKQTAPKI